MHAMVDFYGISWIEPAMLHPFVPVELSGTTYLWLESPNAQHDMKYTSPQQYMYRLKHPSIGIMSLLLSSHILVIDNGTNAYCVFKNPLKER